MKSKGSSSIYEVLKTATRQTGEGAPASETPAAAPPTPEGVPAASSLQERLAAYKAQKLAEVAPAAAPAATATAVATVSRDADPSPVPAAHAPAVSSPPTPTPPSGSTALKGVGERAFRITYNTAVFGALVGIALLFVAYALGVQAGRSKAAGEVALETPVPPLPVSKPKPVEPVVPPPPPPAPKVFTILLTEWPVRTPQERLKADDLAEQMKKALARAGLGAAQAVRIQRGAETRLALYLGQYTSLGTEARKKLEAVQKFRFNNQAAFAKAEFEEAPK